LDSSGFGLAVETAAPNNKNLWDAGLNTQQVLRFNFTDIFRMHPLASFGKKVLQAAARGQKPVRFTGSHFFISFLIGSTWLISRVLLLGVSNPASSRWPSATLQDGSDSDTLQRDL